MILYKKVEKIQIQHLLKLNFLPFRSPKNNSNTTLVKVKFMANLTNLINKEYSNTTLVKVKLVDL